MPPAPEQTQTLEVGPLRIGVEYRKLVPATIDAAYRENAEHLHEIAANSPDGGFSDEGVSIHVEGIEDEHEYLRFDAFAAEPHYHYVDRDAETNTIIELWKRLAPMKSAPVMGISAPIGRMPITVAVPPPRVMLNICRVVSGRSIASKPT